MKKFIVFLAVIALCVGTVFARIALSPSAVTVNAKDAPPLGEMKLITVKQASNLKESEIASIPGLYQYYGSIAEIAQDLNIQLLDTVYAQDNPYAIFKYRTDGENWHVINAAAYIIGDVKMGEKLANSDDYDYQSGEEFISPIDLTIEFIGSEEQYELGFGVEYLGEFRLLESYQSPNGYPVNILRSAVGTDVPKLTAIFVADGIRYTLSGHVRLQTMKDIIASEKI